MNRAYFSFAVLCLIALSGSVLGNPATELNKLMAELDKFQSDYSKEAVTLIGEIKTNMLNGMDAYFRATQSVSEWSNLALGPLDTYKTLLTGEPDQEKFTAQRKLLLQVLDDGIGKMTAGQKELVDSSASLNTAAGKLTELNARLAADFSPDSEYYKSQIAHIRAVAYGSAAPFLIFGLAVAAGVAEGKLIPEFKAKMAAIEKHYREVTDEALNLLDDTKAKLGEEIKRIGEIKTQAKETESYVQLDDIAEVKETILNSVSGLIADCKGYQTRHNTN